MFVRLNVSLLNFKTPGCLPNPTFRRSVHSLQFEADRSVIPDPILLPERPNPRHREAGISDEVVQFFPKDLRGNSSRDRSQTHLKERGKLFWAQVPVSSGHKGDPTKSCFLFLHQSRKSHIGF